MTETGLPANSSSSAVARSSRLAPGCVPLNAVLIVNPAAIHQAMAGIEYRHFGTRSMPRAVHTSWSSSFTTGNASRFPGQTMPFP